MAQETWTTDVLRFWFEELTPDDWYAREPEAVDRRIRERFLSLYERIAAEPPEAVRQTPQAALAACIVLDQFPRNMFRGQPQAFAADTSAAAIARGALASGFDAALPPEQRQFLFMPLMHSEILADQEHCLASFQAVPALADTVKYAVEHRDIVARFGRFPHRNRVLGRESTEAELKFLGGHKGFGQ